MRQVTNTPSLHSYILGKIGSRILHDRVGTACRSINVTWPHPNRLWYNVNMNNLESLSEHPSKDLPYISTAVSKGKVIDTGEKTKRHTFFSLAFPSAFVDFSFASELELESAAICQSD